MWWAIANVDHYITFYFPHLNRTEIICDHDYNQLKTVAVQDIHAILGSVEVWVHEMVGFDS